MWIFVILIFLMSLTDSAIAGLKELTFHSRANCVNNESISWDASRPLQLKTVSHHYLKLKETNLNCESETYRAGFPTHCRQFEYQHTVTADWANTRRSAAVHWGEGELNNPNTWKVEGLHYIFYPGVQEIKLLARTETTDCDIYEGWWD